MEMRRLGADSPDVSRFAWMSSQGACSVPVVGARSIALGPDDLDALDDDRYPASRMTRLDRQVG
jgi:hypothetical protein